RGFIAASSRILTALDNAPRGVMPAAAPRKRIDPMVWRVAATVLVVAAGTLVVVRNGGLNLRTTSRESVPTAAGAPTTMAIARETPRETTTATAAGSVSSAEKVVRTNNPAPARSGAAEESKGAVVGARNLAIEGGAARAAPSLRAAAPPIRFEAGEKRVPAVAAMDAASEEIGRASCRERV